MEYPIIYRIDPELFRTTFRCLITCQYDCCRTGCYITENELKMLRDHINEIRKYMDQEVKDKSWYRVSTSSFSKVSPFKYVILSRTRSGHQKTCIFRRSSDAKCAIHVYDSHLKPLHCQLSPLISLHLLYTKKELTFEHWYQKCKGLGKGTRLAYQLVERKLMPLLKIQLNGRNG